MDTPILFQSSRNTITVTPSMFHYYGNNYPISLISNVRARSLAEPLPLTLLDILLWILALIFFFLAMKFENLWWLLPTAVAGLSANYHLPHYLQKRKRSYIHRVYVSLTTGKDIEVKMADPESAQSLESAIVQALR